MLRVAQRKLHCKWSLGVNVCRCFWRWSSTCVLHTPKAVQTCVHVCMWAHVHITSCTTLIFTHIHALTLATWDDYRCPMHAVAWGLITDHVCVCVWLSWHRMFLVLSLVCVTLLTPNVILLHRTKALAARICAKESGIGYCDHEQVQQLFRDHDREESRRTGGSAAEL